MKPRSLILAFTLITAGLPLCTSTATAKEPEASASAEHEGKKNTTVLTLTAKPEAVHAAALEAVAAVGGKVTKDKADSIEAKRPHKVGLAVGSGGEKLFVSIKDVGNGQVEVTVVSKKTVLGIVGQKLWNDEIAQHIREAIK